MLYHFSGQAKNRVLDDAFASQKGEYLLDGLYYLDAEEGKLYTSIVCVEVGPKPLVFDSPILRFWVNTGNRIRRVSLDLHQYNVESEQPEGIARTSYGCSIKLMTKPDFESVVSNM